MLPLRNKFPQVFKVLFCFLDIRLHISKIAQTVGKSNLMSNYKNNCWKKMRFM
jgi:hypothetical protein